MQYKKIIQQIFLITITIFSIQIFKGNLTAKEIINRYDGNGPYSVSILYRYNENGNRVKDAWIQPQYEEIDTPQGPALKGHYFKKHLMAKVVGKNITSIPNIIMEMMEIYLMSK